MSRAKLDPWLSREGIKEIISYYVDDTKEPASILSPVKQSFDGLPPLLIQVGDKEVLLSGTVMLAERAREAGVKTTLEVWDDMWHVFQAFAILVPEGKEAIRHIGAFVKENTG